MESIRTCVCVFRVIAMMSPEESWVARWQRIGECNVLLIFLCCSGIKAHVVQQRKYKNP